MPNGDTNAASRGPAAEKDDAVVVDLWARRPVCGPRTQVINRLVSLRATGALDSFGIETWPDEIPTDSDHSEYLDLIEEFEAWAADHGLSLRPPLETRTASMLVGGDAEVLVTPMLLVAVYKGQNLAGVFPCTDGDTTWTVEQFLDAYDPEREDTAGGLPLPDGVSASE